MATIPGTIDDYDPWEIPTEPVRRFTVAEYHALQAAGVVTEEDPYELIEGWLVRKMTKKPPHEYALSYLDDLIAASLSSPWQRRCQLAITLADGEPEPDIAIVSGPRDKYIARHPGGAEVAVVIEVSDVTLARDRGAKLRSYARAGIATYWIVNCVQRQIEIYTLPDGQGAYAEQQIVPQGGIATLMIDDAHMVDVEVSELFPSAISS